MIDSDPNNKIEESGGAWGSLSRSPEPLQRGLPSQLPSGRDCTNSCTDSCTSPGVHCTIDCTTGCSVDTVRLVGVRGGSGASTVAAVLALHAATMVNTELVTPDLEAACALLGLSAPDEVSGQIADHLVLSAQTGLDSGLAVVDHGTLRTAAEACARGRGERRIGVLRGPCYLALRTLMATEHDLDGLILVAEPGRALNERDITDVTGLEVLATVSASPAIARVIDAGLLAARYRNLAEFRSLRRWLTLQLDPFPTRLSRPRRAAPNHLTMSGTDLLLPPSANVAVASRSLGGKIRILAPGLR